jgi:hypothetical protein
VLELVLVFGLAILCPLESQLIRLAHVVSRLVLVNSS